MKQYIKVAVVTVAMSISGVAAQQPRTITLQEAITIALRQSSDVARAENQQALNGLAVSESKSRFLPDLSFSTGSSQSYGRTFSEAEGGLVTQSTNAVNFRVGSSVTLFDGFANAAGLKIAKLNLVAGSHDTERTRQSLVLNVAAGFLAVTEAKEQARVAADNLAMQQERERDIATLVKAGSRAARSLRRRHRARAARKSCRPSIHWLREHSWHART